MLSTPPELCALLAVLALTGAGASLGLPLARALPNSLVPLERRAFQTLAGLGLLGVFSFLTGLWRLSQWTALLTVGVALLPAVISRFGSSRLRPGLPPLVPRTRRAISLRQWPYALAALILLAGVIAAFDLPRGTSDEISYHLLGPKTWLREGSVHPVLEHSHTAFPATVELLFALGMALSNDRAPGLLTIVFASLLLVQTWGLVRRLGADERTARIAVLLAATTPAILVRVGAAFVDCAFAAFVLAAARILLELPQGWQLIAGAAFAGFAIGTKYTGVIDAAILAVLFLIPIGIPRRFRERLNGALTAGFVALLVGCPWYIRNYVELGSPVYPPPAFLARLLPVKAMPLRSVMEFSAYIMTWGGASFGRSPTDFLLLPFRMTFECPAFGGFAGGIGLAMLAFTPIGILLLRRSDFAVRALVWSLLLTLGWFLTQQELRFTVPMLIVLTGFAAFGVVRCMDQQSRLGRVLAMIALGVTIAHGAWLDFSEQAPRIRAVLTGRGRQRYDRARMPGSRLIEFVNTQPEVGRVLINGPDFKLYYLDKPFVVIQGEHGERPNDAIPDAAAALRNIGDLNVTHFIDAPTPPAAFLDVRGVPRLEMLFEDDGMRIYRVR